MHVCNQNRQPTNTEQNNEPVTYEVLKSQTEVFHSQLQKTKSEIAKLQNYYKQFNTTCSFHFDPLSDAPSRDASVLKI